MTSHNVTNCNEVRYNYEKNAFWKCFVYSSRPVVIPFIFQNAEYQITLNNNCAYYFVDMKRGQNTDEVFRRKNNEVNGKYRMLLAHIEERPAPYRSLYTVVRILKCTSHKWSCQCSAWRGRRANTEFSSEKLLKNMN
jgi:hypothetical protein